MRGAIGAVVAVDGFAWREGSVSVWTEGLEQNSDEGRIGGRNNGGMRRWVGRRTGVAGVGVGFGISFGDFEVVFVAHLVKGGLAAGEELAGVAVAAMDELWSAGRMNIPSPLWGIE